jgi:hypothetical protein
VGGFCLSSLLSFSQQAKIATSLGLDALLAFLLAVNENEHGFTFDLINMRKHNKLCKGWQEQKTSCLNLVQFC